jgi:GTP-binding protein
MNKKIDVFFKVTRPQFLIGTTDKKQFPKQIKTEIAFVGRSNVGKSSLINAITHSSIARTSKTPGRTREINFFGFGENCNFIDMPGYGFAYATEAERNLWKRNIEQYLANREQLIRLFLLIDSRRGITPKDFEFMEILDVLKTKYQIILTKVDAINRDECSKVSAEITAEINNHENVIKEILFSSADKGYGLAEIRETIYNLIKDKQKI